jgi:hypothetical protein
MQISLILGPEKEAGRGVERIVIPGRAIQNIYIIIKQGIWKIPARLNTQKRSPYRLIAERILALKIRVIPCFQ